jgi:cytochrome P450
MDLDFDAQMDKARQSEIIQLFDTLIHAYANNSDSLLTVPNPFVIWERLRLSRRIDYLLKQIVQEKFAEQRALRGSGSTKSRSVLSLSLQDIDRLTPTVLDQTVDQIKSFLLAGHDTTSILLQWAFYELSRTPRALTQVRAELDEIFGLDPDPSIVRDKLLCRGEDLIRRMSYTSAVIKEVLRLYPPAGTARRAKPGTGFNIRLPDGQQLCLDGLVIYNCQSLIHRDEAVYGDTRDDFMPERWLGDTDTSMQTNIDRPTDEKAGAVRGGKIPPSAWRPFERGPRNCIGQELANIEARVILACTVRRYDFVKVGLGEADLDEMGQPVLNTKQQYKVKSELYNVRVLHKCHSLILGQAN